MKSVSNPDQPIQDLDKVLEEIANAIASGSPVDLDRYTEEFPHYAEQLRNYVLSMQLLADFGELDSSAEAPVLDDAGSPNNGILGDYRLIGELGRGGMGVAYEAEQISLDRKVALKILPFASMLDDRQLQRFKNEARAAATLDHPHIVSIFSVGIFVAFSASGKSGKTKNAKLDEIELRGSEQLYVGKLLRTDDSLLRLHLQHAGRTHCRGRSLSTAPPAVGPDDRCRCHEF